jgi:hypothetical protein
MTEAQAITDLLQHCKELNAFCSQGNRAMLLQRCETPSPSGRGLG